MARVIIEEEENGAGQVGIPANTPPSNPPPILPPIADTAGSVLVSDGDEPAWVHLGGDLSGSADDVVVVGLQGRPVASTPPSDGQALIWSASGGRWQPGTVSGGSNPQEYVFSDGSYLHRLHVGAVTDGTWLDIVPGDPIQPTFFRGSFRSTANAGGYQNDDVVDLGFHAGGGGGLGGASFAIESGFYTGSTFQQEIHVRTWAPADGVETRLLSGEQHFDGTTALYLAATGGNIGSGNSSSAPAALSWGTTAARLASPGFQLNYVDVTNDQIVINLGNSSHPPNAIQVYDSTMAIAVRNGNLGNNAPPQLSWDSGGAYAGGAFYAVAGVGMYGATPGNQYSTTGTVTGFTAGSGTGVNDVSTFTGNTGTTAYTISDLVRAMKYYGQLAL